MIPERPPLYSYRNQNGEWAPAPFEKVSARAGDALKIDIKFPMLGFLMDAEMTGYDLKRRFQESVGFFYRVSDGSLYPALKKLARDKLVTMRTERNGKRARKVYAITPIGREHFLKMLAEPSPPVFVHDEAQVKIYFGHHNPESAVAHMQRMHRFNVDMAEHLSQLVGEMETRGENPFRKVLLKFGHQITAHTVQLIKKLEVEMSSELAALARGRTAGAIARRTAARTANVHKQTRSVLVKR
jgi:DNA-binding PadR family transcriptional regulator